MLTSMNFDELRLYDMEREFGKFHSYVWMDLNEIRTMAKWLLAK